MKSEACFRITSLARDGNAAAARELLEMHRSELPDTEALGNICFYEKRKQDAIDKYEIAMESSKEYDCARYHYLLGVTAERAGNLTDAFKRYQAAIMIEPQFVDTYIELGGLLVKVDDFEGALQCYTDAAELAPHDVSVLSNLVTVLTVLAKADVSTYSQALRDAETRYVIGKRAFGAPSCDFIW